MIVDTSALIAIIRQEPEAEAFIAAIVIDARRDPALSRDFDRLIAPIAIAPVTAAQARLAREAYRDFGKGAGHPAQLNFCDCFVFALAQETGAAILFKGRDFGLRALFLRRSGGAFPLPARPACNVALASRTGQSGGEAFAFASRNQALRDFARQNLWQRSCFPAACLRGRGPGQDRRRAGRLSGTACRYRGGRPDFSARRLPGRGVHTGIRASLCFTHRKAAHRRIKPGSCRPC